MLNRVFLSLICVFITFSSYSATVTDVERLDNIVYIITAVLYILKKVLERNKAKVKQ